MRGQRRVDDLDELELGLLALLEQGRPAAEEHRHEVDADLLDEARGEVLTEREGASHHATPLSPAAASACSSASSMPPVTKV